jgi:predicted AAA+ superfamily ATPase
MLILRKISAYLTEIGKYFPIINLTGPRQAGKTTFLRNCGKINYPFESRDLNEFDIYSIKPRTTYFSATP